MKAAKKFGHGACCYESLDTALKQVRSKDRLKTTKSRDDFELVLGRSASNTTLGLDERTASRLQFFVEYSAEPHAIIQRIQRTKTALF